MLTVIVETGVVKAAFQGKALDASNTDAFKNAIQGQLIDSVRLVLDMQTVEFVDSSGLGALVWLMREVESRQGKLALAHVNRSVQILLEMVRMHRLFDIHPNVQQASAAVGGAG